MSVLSSVTQSRWLCLPEMKSMAQWCSMTSHVVLFRLSTTALLLVTFLELHYQAQNPTEGQDCQPQDCAVHLSNTRTGQPPPGTLPTSGSMPVAPLGTGLSLSLRGSIGLFLQIPRVSYWHQHCWGCAELDLSPGCPSHLLALLFFPHLPSSKTILATLNPCIWWRKLQAACAITTSPSYCSTALLPVTLGEILCKCPCSNHCQNITLLYLRNIYIHI